MRKINVLITHASYQASAGSFIKLLRSSEAFNYYIVGCDSIEKGYSSGSMLVDKFYHLPFDTSNREYISSILKICLEEKINLIITAEEDDLIVFKKEEIPQSFYQYIPDFSIFDLFRDKYNATMDLQAKGFAVPRSIMSFAEFEKSEKDVFIYRKRVACCSRGIRIFNRNEISHDYNFFSEAHITQEFLKGKMYTVDVLCDKYGKISMAIPRRDISSKDGTTFKCVIERIVSRLFMREIL